MDLWGTPFFASSKTVFGAENLASARGGHARCNSLCLGWEPEGCSEGVVFVASARSEYAAAVECLRQTNPFYAEVTLGDGGEDLLEGCVLETAEDSALANELLQKGPADAQGQETGRRRKTMAPLKTKIEAKRYQAERGCCERMYYLSFCDVCLTVEALACFVSRSSAFPEDAL